ncbi:MAG: HEAT repeat domain-containing protein, partial [Planctomycetota bacterium]|nr:HEAT repeat domain-containing protein [Planctomycetota bacterium]
MTILLAASLLFFQSAHQSPIDPLAAARAEARARYQKVELELTRTRLDTLSPEQRAARARLLEVLEAYVERADFGVQDFELAARVPQFVDADGRRCAMAELLHSTGEDELILAVARANNTAWIAELSGDTRFLGWLDRNGLTLDEAARIQGPSMPEPPRALPPVYNGPSDVVPTPSGPSTPSSPAPDAPARPAPGAGTPGGSVPAAGTPAPASTTPQQQPFGPFSFSDADASWWLWWEYNKLEFLRPNRFALETRRDDDVGRTFTSQLDFLRRTIEPVVERLIDHPDARLRAAAAGALGRFGGERNVEQLLPLVLDANPEVRDAALLGLGASGTREAQLPLMEIASKGRFDGKEIGRRTRALAVVALGLGRSCGFDASADEVALAVATQGTPSDRHELGIAAMSCALLAPSDKLVELAEKLANDKGLPMPLRSRALEVLRARSDSATLAELQHLASGARLELRRSAALTLGEFEHPLASAGLRTAQDLEKEPVA